MPGSADPNVSGLRHLTSELSGPPPQPLEEQAANRRVRSNARLNITAAIRAGRSVECLPIEERTCAGYSRNVFPTAEGTTAWPKADVSAPIARQPVQCPAAIVFRLNARIASTVSGMIFSMLPDRWKPPITP